MTKPELTGLQTEILDIVRDGGNISRIIVARRLQTTVRAITPAVRALVTRNLIVHDESGFLRPVTTEPHRTTSNTTKQAFKMVKIKKNCRRSDRYVKSLTIDEILESGMFKRPEKDFLINLRQPERRHMPVSRRGRVSRRDVGRRAQRVGVAADHPQPYAQPVIDPQEIARLRHVVALAIADAKNALEQYTTTEDSE